MRPFFFLVFLTFVFCYVMEHGVEKLEGRIQSRRLRSVLVFGALLLALVGLGLTIGPSLADQARAFPGEVRGHLERLDGRIEDLRGESDLLAQMIPADQSATTFLGEVLGLGGSHDADEEVSAAQRFKPIVPFVVSFARQTLALSTAFLLFDRSGGIEAL